MPPTSLEIIGMKELEPRVMKNPKHKEPGLHQYLNKQTEIRTGLPRK
jgi:hypothetical protein